MLNQYNLSSLKVSANPHLEFANATDSYPDQVYSKNPTDVNAAIQTHVDLQRWSDRSLTAVQLWEGEKLKGKAPQVFTNPIVVAVVLEDSVKQTPYGEVYTRLSIQPSWITGNLVVVKEETHADDYAQKMLFLGREVDINEAKLHLIPVILKDIALGSDKAKKLIPEGFSEGEAKGYLEDNFESLFCNEHPALFHVCHGVVEKEEKVYETWDLVRLASSDPDHNEIYQELRNNIYTSISAKLYDETFKHAENKVALSY